MGLTCPKTVHQRPCMMREIETWLSDSRVGNNSVADHKSRRPVLSTAWLCRQTSGIRLLKHLHTTVIKYTITTECWSYFCVHAWMSLLQRRRPPYTATTDDQIFAPTARHPQARPADDDDQIALLLLAMYSSTYTWQHWWVQAMLHKPSPFAVLVSGTCSGLIVSTSDCGVRTKVRKTLQAVYHDSRCDIQPWAWAAHLSCSA